MKRRAFICAGMAAILASRRAPAFCVAMRNGMMRPIGAPTPPLPYDYAVEYIETDGVASYIDTGCYAGVNFQWDLDFQVVSWPPGEAVTYARSICGAQWGNGSTRRYFGLFISTRYGDKFVFGNPSSSASNDDGSPGFSLDRHAASSSYGSLLFDGESITITSAAQQDRHALFFIGRCGAFDVDASIPLRSYSNVRVYSCVLRDNGAIVFNGIPVVSNGVAGMYDSISGTFKGNAAATGTITAGPRRAQ